MGTEFSYQGNPRQQAGRPGIEQVANPTRHPSCVHDQADLCQRLGPLSVEPRAEPVHQRRRKVDTGGRAKSRGGLVSSNMVQQPFGKRNSLGVSDIAPPPGVYGGEKPPFDLHPVP